MSQYKNVFVVNSTWQLTSAVREVEPVDSLSHAQSPYERLESRLRLQRAVLNECLARQASTRHQLDMLRLTAFLATLLIAMKRRAKVPDVARMLHSMAGTL